MGAFFEKRWRKEETMRRESAERWLAVALACGLMSGAAWAGPPAQPKPNGKYELLKEPSTHQAGKVKLTEFADFYCPHCHAFEQALVPFIEKEFSGKVEVDMVGFPVIGGKLPTAFEMYEQARAMGKGVEMKKVLFRTIHKDRLHVLDKVIRETLIKEVGLNPAAFEAGLASGKPAEALHAGRKWGERVKVQSTPTVVLDGNIKVEGENLNPENLKTVIASILAGDKKR
jgi:thiol:disulfide interchange protein DsbA